jgi:hypothetical protein
MAEFQVYIDDNNRKVFVLSRSGEDRSFRKFTEIPGNFGEAVIERAHQVATALDAQQLDPPEEPTKRLD